MLGLHKYSRRHILLVVILAPLLTAFAAKAASVPSSPHDIPFSGQIELNVDARDVERGIFRVRERIPVNQVGDLTLLFATWVPGNHAPTARIDRMAGLIVGTHGKRLNWERDAINMHAFHVAVPKGADTLDVEFQYLSATDPAEGRVVMTPAMLNLQWFSLILYPAGHYARQIMVEPRVTLPQGWRATTQLAVAADASAVIRFKPVNLEALMDAPLFAGRYFRSFPLGTIGKAPMFMDVVADDPKYLQAQPSAIDAHRRLIAEVGQLFGRPPFGQYNFMLGLTSELGDIGTEHLASSENTRPPTYLTDWQWSALLAHELVHSWIGKARRPADLWSPDFNVPMRNSMLWIYEGQAQFWGFVLAARSGLMTREQVMDVFARLAAQQTQQPGRSWRPLADTGNDAIMTRELFDEPWPTWHRSLDDSYAEGDLLWLEADGIIRERSNGARGMDDFAGSFFAGGGERPSLFNFNDVVAGLNRVQPYDWAGFLNVRLHETSPAVPQEWLRRAGYQLVFRDSPTAAFMEHETRGNSIDLRYSLGLVLHVGPSGKIEDVIWNGPAFQAGLVPNANILFVNGARYRSNLLLAAIQKNRGGGHPIHLRVMNRNHERDITLDVKTGPRYPRLQRVNNVPDRLGNLLKPRMAASVP